MEDDRAGLRQLTQKQGLVYDAQQLALGIFIQTVPANVPDDDSTKPLLLYIPELGFYPAVVFVREELVRLRNTQVRNLRLLIPARWIIFQKFVNDLAVI